MSFSGEIKEELSQKVSTARHCQIAELAAIMGMCGGVVITSGDRYRVKIQTDSLPVARKCFTLLQKIFNIEPEISIRQHQKPQKTRIYTILVPGHEDALRVLQALKLIDGHMEIRENLTAAEMMINKVTETNVQPNEEQMGGMGDWDLFQSGRLGMIPTGIWAFATFTDGCDFAWDICVEPGGTQKATHFFSNALVVNAKSDKKEAAATWINWLASSDKSAQMRIDAGWDLPAVNNQEVLSGYLAITPPENRQSVFDSLNYLVVAPIIEDYSLMADIITDKLTMAASGKITVKDALDQAQSECEAQITLK